MKIRIAIIAALGLALALYLVKYVGLGAVFEPHVPLDRALGQDAVDMRTEFNETMLNWPKRYRDLAAYHAVVLTDLPAASVTERQLQDLRRYVEEGQSVPVNSLCAYVGEPGEVVPDAAPDRPAPAIGACVRAS